MNLAMIAGALVGGQIVAGGWAAIVFRRAWYAALAEPADSSLAVDAFPTTADGVAGWYRPATDQIFIAPYLHHARSLAELAVVVHEQGHRHQQSTRPWTIRLQAPLRALAILTSSLGGLLAVLGLLLVNPELPELGVIIAGINLFGSVGLVALEWDASRLGLATVGASRDHPKTVRLLLRLAGLTYLLLPLTIVEPILSPTSAPSLPLAPRKTPDARSERTSAARRKSHGERGTEDSTHQPGGT